MASDHNLCQIQSDQGSPNSSHDCDVMSLDQRVRSLITVYNRLEAMEVSDACNEGYLRNDPHLERGVEEEKTASESQSEEFRHDTSRSRLDLSISKSKFLNNVGGSQSSDCRNKEHCRIATYRKRFVQYDIRRLRRLVEREASTVGSSSVTDIRPSQIKNYKLLLSSEKDKRKISRKIEVKTVVAQEVDESLENLRCRLSKARFLIRSSLGLTNEQSTDSAIFSQENQDGSEKIASSWNAASRHYESLNPLRGENLQNIDHPQNMVDSESSEINSPSLIQFQAFPGLDTLEAESKIDFECMDGFPSVFEHKNGHCRVSDDIISLGPIHVQWQSNELRGIPAFDPFVLSGPEAIEWQETPWCDPSYSFDSESPAADDDICEDLSSVDVVKGSKDSKTTSSTQKFLAKTTISNDKDSNARTVGLFPEKACFSPFHNGDEISLEKADDDEGQKSLCTEQSSFQSGSSLGAPASPIIRKSGEKRRKKRLSFLRWSRPKSANKEWLVAANASDWHVLRSRDVRMKEWLSRSEVSEEHKMIAVFFD